MNLHLQRPDTRYACALLLAALWLSLASAPAGAATTCYSAASTNWNLASTWSSTSGGAGNTCSMAPSGYPGASDTAYIENAHTVTVTETQAATAVIVNAPSTNNTTTLNVATGTLNVGSGGVGGVAINGGTGNRIAEVSIGTGTLTVGTDLTPNTPAAGNAKVTFTGAGALNIGRHFLSGGANTAAYTPATGTVTYNGTVAQNVGAYNYYNLTINKSNIATLLGSVTIGNNLTVTTGTLDLASYTANRGTAGGALSVAASATLKVGATLPANYGSYTFNPTSTVNYAQAGGTQDVSVQTYGHLTLSNGGTKRMLAGTTTVAGDFTLGTTTTYDGTTNNPLVNLAGHFTNNGTFNSGSGAFTFNGTVNQNISGNTSFANLVIANAAGVTAGTSTSLALGTFTVNPASTFNAGTSSHSVSGNFSNNGTFNADTSTVTFNGTAAQNLTGATTFYRLIMNNAAGLTLNDDVTVSNLLTFTSGKITTLAAATTPPDPYLKTLTVGTCTADTSVSGAAQSTGWVVGNLKKYVPFGASTVCAFEVGGTAYYSPITDVTFGSVSTAGYMTGAAMPFADGHPVIDNTDINPTQNVNRFWTLKDSTAVFDSYSAIFRFNTADLDADADTNNFLIRRYTPPYPPSDGTWGNVTVGTLAATSTQGLAITGIGDFAIGNSGISAFLREPEWVYQRELYYQ